MFKLTQLKKLAILGIFMAFNLPAHGTFVIAHRGASGYAPENTLRAVEKAIELNSEYIEIDVHQTKDGQVVAIHDTWVNRTTDGSGKVGNYTFEEISKLDAGSWYGEEFKGEKVPHLKEVLEAIPSTSKLIIEVKDGNWTYPNIEKNIVELVKKYGLEDQVILKSFSKDVLKTFKTLAPDIPRLYVILGSIPWIGVTFDTWFRWGNFFTEINTEFVSYIQVHRYFLTKSFMKKAQDQGLKVIVWDVHKPAHIKSALEMGVDGIETNYPDRVLDLR